MMWLLLLYLKAGETAELFTAFNLGACSLADTFIFVFVDV